MMELHEIASMLAGLGIPLAYHHFAEGESPPPPFLLYLSPGSDNFSADGRVYWKVAQLDVELYTDLKDPELEARLEWCWTPLACSTTKRSPTSTLRNSTKFCMKWRSDLWETRSNII